MEEAIDIGIARLNACCKGTCRLQNIHLCEAHIDSLMYVPYGSRNDSYSCFLLSRFFHIDLQALGLDLRASSLFAFLPWVVMSVSSLVNGLVADIMVARGIGTTTVRKVLQSLAFSVPAVALLALGTVNVTPTFALWCFVASLAATPLGQVNSLCHLIHATLQDTITNLM